MCDCSKIVTRTSVFSHGCCQAVVYSVGSGVRGGHSRRYPNYQPFLGRWSSGSACPVSWWGCRAGAGTLPPPQGTTSSAPWWSLREPQLSLMLPDQLLPTCGLLLEFVCKKHSFRPLLISWTSGGSCSAVVCHVAEQEVCPDFHLL